MGINIKPTQIINTLEIFTAPLGKITWHMFPIIIELDEIPSFSLNDENIAAKFVAKDDLYDLEMIPVVKDFITKQFKIHLDKTNEDNSEGKVK